jgi:Flp pilus assembly protein TadG
MKHWMQLVPRLRTDRRGNALVEFALGSGILVAAFAGVFQFGYTFLQYNNLQNAVARGARYASLAPYDSATSTPSSTFNTAVQNMVLYGQPTAGTSPVVSGLASSNVNFTVTFANGIPSVMTVSITGYSIQSLFGTQTLTNKPQTAFAYQGIWSPI